MVDNEGIVMRPPLTPTFQLPTHEEVLAVRCGDSVKLVFEGEFGERMWVRVIEQRSPTEWYGILSNEPVVIESLEFGARIRFHPLDIIDVVYNRGGESETCG